MRVSQERGVSAPETRALTAGLVLSITFVASEALEVVTVMPVAARDLGGIGLYGWVFSAFMLGNIVGIVAAGREADRRGPAIPFVAGLVLFAAGLIVAGLAPSMGVLVAGRALQGLGAGAVPAVAYVSIGRSLAGPQRARMMAVLSTAWVAPGVAGPALRSEEHTSELPSPVHLVCRLLLEKKKLFPISKLLNKIKTKTKIIS